MPHVQQNAEHAADGEAPRGSSAALNALLSIDVSRFASLESLSEQFRRHADN